MAKRLRIFDIFPIGATWIQEEESPEDEGGPHVRIRPYDLWEVRRYQEEESLFLMLTVAMTN